MYLSKIKKYFKDYTFKQWLKLADKIKYEITGYYWSPYEPQNGNKTRKAIIKAFKKKYPEIVSKSHAIGFDDFDKWGGGYDIYVVKKTSVRIPEHFACCMIYKGNILKKYKNNRYLINFRNYGKNIYRIKNGKIFL